MAETSGTWTSATHITVAVYRGSYPPSGSPAPDDDEANSATMTYAQGGFTPATYPASLGTGWYAAFAAHSTATNTGTAPTGMTNCAVGGTQAAVHDTNGTVSTNWAAGHSVGVNASGKWVTYLMQIAANGTVSRVGANAGNGASIAIPAGHQVGDLIVICAFRLDVAGSPSIASGYTNVTSFSHGVVGVGGCVGYRIVVSPDSVFVPQISVY